MAGPELLRIHAEHSELVLEVSLWALGVLALLIVALKYLVKGRGDEFSMEKEAGKLFTAPDYPDVQFMVLYHPAFLLRDPTKKAVMWEHVKKLRAFLSEHGWTPSFSQQANHSRIP